MKGEKKKKNTRIHYCTVPWVPRSLDIRLLLFTFRVFLCLCFPVGFLGVSVGKESACNAGEPGLIPGSGRSLDKEMATHTSSIAWRIPGTEEPWGLQSMLQRVGHNWETNAFTTLLCLCYLPPSPYLSFHHLIHCFRSNKGPNRRQKAGRNLTYWNSYPYQFSSVSQSCLTLCDLMNIATEINLRGENWRKWERQMNWVWDWRC